MTIIETAELESPVGCLTLAVHAGRLCALDFAENWPRRRAALERRFPRGERSEERRVGEEGRARGGPCHLKKKKRKETVGVRVRERATGVDGLRGRDNPAVRLTH